MGGVRRWLMSVVSRGGFEAMAKLEMQSAAPNYRLVIRAPN